MHEEPEHIEPQDQASKGRFSFFKEKRQAFRKKYPKTAMLMRISFWAGAFVIALVFGFAVSVYFGAFGKLPTKSELENIKSSVASKVYSADGIVIGKFYLENRIFVDLEDMSPHLIHALVATEDERFFKHKGIDFRSIGRVLIKTILLRKHSGGGSTISQQLAKNLFKRKEKGFLKMPIIKFKEIFISWRLEKVYSKEELLELYLNTVPFGNRLFGIEVASNNYFRKKASTLDLHEAAVLIGMLKGTGLYNPVSHPEKSLTRRNVVLSQMAKNGYLSDDELTEQKNKKLETHFRKEGSNEGTATYFREQVRQDVKAILKQFKKEDGTPYDLYTDGLKIYTTIDSKIQSYAENAAKSHVKKLQKQFDRHWRKRKKPWQKNKAILPFMKQSDRFQQLKNQGLPDEQNYASFLDKRHMRLFTWSGLRDTMMTPKDSIVHYLSFLNAGVLAIDVKTGGVKAWVGGVNFRNFKYDHVKAKRQVGSTFKPFVYAAAINAGRSPCEYISNDSLRIQDEGKYWTPNNAEGHYSGYYSMSGALAHSVNVAAVRMIMEAGIAPVISLAQMNGFNSVIPKVPSIALGSMDGSLQEMVTMYTTIAGRGRVKEPYYLTRIETADGQEIVQFSHKKNHAQGLPTNTSALLTNMLEMAVDSGTARRLYHRYHLPKGIAGKTGTTQGQSDGWFIGYTPELAMGVWVGGELPSVRFRSLSLGQGANTALPIWGLTMQQIVKNKRLKKYHPRAFPKLADSLAQMLNCPAFVASLIVEELEVISPEDEGILDKVLREHRERAKNRKTKRKKSNRPHRKEKRKKWWQKVFGG